MAHPRYIVGIDLGTTNSALAYVDTADPERRIHALPIQQLVAESRVAERPTLPSFVYVAGEHDVRPGSLALPWAAERSYAVGEFARVQGTRVPGRLISSAKSWLCHGGVDREAPILPWGAAEEVPKISPVEAASRYLQHLAEVWRQRFPGAPLDAQDVVLTVPASFDEVARELTVAAAERCGLTRAVLLEEPQAAFYAWVHANERNWEQQVSAAELVLVVDIGGGTTDFSLVAIRREGDRTGLERLAVGEHLLLGGDNIDLALAALLEQRLGTKLDSQRWLALTNLCRGAKELLLGDEAPDEAPVRLAGKGRAVIGGALAASLSKEETEHLVLNEFFPVTDPDEPPKPESRRGAQEWGLPLATERAVSRHLAAFLRDHCTDAGGGSRLWPDTILFNGGALAPRLIRDRLLRLLKEWRGGQELTILRNTDLELAVAQGATYYGLARRGLGVRIGGGSARAYYLGVEKDDEISGDSVPVLCLVPRGLREGEEIDVASEFTLLANRPVSFPLYASSTRLGDTAGSVLEAANDSLTRLPPIRTVLRFGKKLAAAEIPARVGARLTEIGTLEIWCRSMRTDHRWRLQFDLRDALQAGNQKVAGQTGAELAVGGQRLSAALAALRGVFPAAIPPPEDQAAASGAHDDPVGLVRTLEKALGAGKDAWPLDCIRNLWDALWEGRDRRDTGHAHEGRWLNLCGFLLRPGFGYEMDDWRIQQLWRILPEGLRFPRAVQVRAEWWNMWKRVAGGLSRPQQQELYNQTAPWLLPRLKSKRKRLAAKSGVGPQELREYWQLLANCERLASQAKAELGEVVLRSLIKGKASDAEIWALGRLGTRTPFYGPLNCVVGRTTVEAWVETLLQRPWQRAPIVGFATVQLARCVGDRERDLDEDLRRRLAERLQAMPGGGRAVRLVTECLPLDVQEHSRIFADSLPAGLKLKGS